ncbi:hypothetical protein NITHO_3760002 [Nitrolancea hollandica Lb]|uniref:Uncharacterized protein n=1 Tax=Nitrolancea hollandica Lb TaxID=1129897 RepID=I4EJ11_9BACT|nr:hypothetical protein NITHO_3760002 [Nitrolancea hollandica Lb]
MPWIWEILTGRVAHKLDHTNDKQALGRQGFGTFSRPFTQGRQNTHGTAGRREAALRSLQRSP